MATNFPASLDTLTNPSATDTLDSPPHDEQHADANDAIEALQAKVGVDGSAVTSSLDYKVANLESRPVETKTASYVLVAADVNKRIVMNNAGATTITVNDGVFAAGDTVWIHNIGAGTTTVTAGTATVNTAASLDLAQWEGGSLYFTSASSAIFFRGGGVATFDVDYLVVAGGGAGGGNFGSNTPGGGGGAGGYRCSVTGEDSGGGASAESKFQAQVDVAYWVFVGAGGSGAVGDTADISTSGSASIFGSVASSGGGVGGGITNVPASYGPAVGGSGGGGRGTNSGAAGTTGQGFAGAAASTSGEGGGGGGAGAAAVVPASAVGGNGGAGVSSSITGSSVARGGGGGGADLGGTAGSGGTGGGGAGSTSGAATAGTANTGGGGGGGGTSGSGGNGGSGVVIIRFPTAQGSPTIGAGLTSSSTTDGTDTIITFTAGADTITWSS